MECKYALLDHFDQRQFSRKERRIRTERRRRAYIRKAIALVILGIGVTTATTAAITMAPTSEAMDKPPAAVTSTPTTRVDDTAYIVESVAADIPIEPVFKALDVPMDAELQSGINDLCQDYGAPFELIMAIIDNESDFNPAAVSYDGRDYGLMQIRDVNHPQLTEDLGVTDFLDPLQNAECGIYMISGYIKKYGDLNLALMAYNCGETGARKLWDKGTYSTEYSRSIIRQMDEFTAEREG